MSTCRGGRTNGAGTFLFLVGLAAVTLWAFPVRGEVLLSDDFSGSSLDPAWVQWDTGPNDWYINTTYHVAACSWANGIGAHMTRDLSAPTTSWSVNLRYGWFYGNATTAARHRFIVMDDMTNGYGIYMEQAARGGSPTIEKYTGGTRSGVAGGSLTKPFGDNGILAGGALTPMRLDWEASTGTLSLYLGNPGDPAGSATNLFAAVTDTAGVCDPVTFTKLRLLDVSPGAYVALFDDVVVESIPEPEPNPYVVLEDRFRCQALDPAWVHGGVGSPAWAISTTYGVAASSSTTGGHPTPGVHITRAFSRPVQDWDLTLRYGWFYGITSLAPRDQFAVLDDAGNGYGIYMEQGARSGSPSIQKFTGGFASGTVPGGSLTKPFGDSGILQGGALTPLRLEWRAGSGTLNLYLGAPGDPAGSATALFASVTDTTYVDTMFTKLRLADICSGGYRSLYDDVYVEAVPAATSGTLLALGLALALIRRRLTGRV